MQIDRPIPGLYATSTAAVEAQAEAQRKWDACEEVWPAPPAANRNARGQVCPPHCARLSHSPSHVAALCHRDQRDLLDGRTARRSGTTRAAVEEGQGRGRRSRQQPEEPRQQTSPAGQAVGRPVGDTVPLPAQRCSACKHCIVDYLSDTCGMCAEIAPLLPENTAGPAGSTRVLPPVPVALAPASPNLISSGPRVRGWLQREIDEGLCVAPVAQVPVLCARAA